MPRSTLPEYTVTCAAESMARKLSTCGQRDAACAAIGSSGRAHAAGREGEADDQRAAACQQIAPRRMICCSSLLPCTDRRALDRVTMRSMRAASAEIVGERVLDRPPRSVLVAGQEGRGLHDHAVDAVTALHRLLFDERALHRMRIFRRAQPFQRDDFVVFA